MKRLLGSLLFVAVTELTAATALDSMPRGVTWLVEYVVGADSMPKDIKIIVTADPKLDSKVIAAVAKAWKSPPEFTGRKFRQNFPYVGQWPEGPKYSPNAKYVEVDFVIDALGAPKDIKIRNPEDRTESPAGAEGSRMVDGNRGAVIEKSEEELVIATVAQWRFPSDLEGKRWIHGFYFEPKDQKPNQALEPTSGLRPAVAHL